MPSSRRVKVLLITVGFIFLSIIYLTSNARRSNQQFYDRTVAALEANAKAKLQAEEAAAKSPDEFDKDDPDKDGAQVPLAGVAGPQEEPAAARKGADADVPVNAGSREPVPEVKKQSEGGGDSNSDKEREKSKDSEKDKGDGKAGLRPGSGVGDKKWSTDADKNGEIKEEKKEEKSKEEKEVEAELNSILKRSPIIIFSKTYCPFSKKAKAIFEKYTITPAPFIVELDEHKLGPGLQDALGKTTKRKTVPNILVAGVSIGGGDEVVAMDEMGELEGKIKSLGGKRIMEIKKKGK